MITDKSPDQLAKEEVERQALLSAAKMLESKEGNELYRRAWRIAAGFVREMALQGSKTF